LQAPITLIEWHTLLLSIHRFHSAVLLTKTYRPGLRARTYCSSSATFALLIGGTVALHRALFGRVGV
jgi:hypothetical protein